jgi:hypothetical protein
VSGFQLSQACTRDFDLIGKHLSVKSMWCFMSELLCSAADHSRLSEYEQSYFALGMVLIAFTWPALGPSHSMLLHSTCGCSNDGALAVPQKHASEQHPMEVTVFDVGGIGAGGSGAAAGLLHPFSPNGKVPA